MFVAMEDKRPERHPQQSRTIAYVISKIFDRRSTRKQNKQALKKSNKNKSACINDYKHSESISFGSRIYNTGLNIIPQEPSPEERLLISGLHQLKITYLQSLMQPKQLERTIQFYRERSTHSQTLDSASNRRYIDCKISSNSCENSTNQITTVNVYDGGVSSIFISNGTNIDSIPALLLNDRKMHESRIITSTLKTNPLQAASNKEQADSCGNSISKDVCHSTPGNRGINRETKSHSKTTQHLQQNGLRPKNIPPVLEGEGKTFGYGQPSKQEGLDRDVELRVSTPYHSSGSSHETPDKDKTTSSYHTKLKEDMSHILDLHRVKKNMDCNVDPYIDYDIEPNIDYNFDSNIDPNISHNLYSLKESCGQTFSATSVPFDATTQRTTKSDQREDLAFKSGSVFDPSVGGSDQKLSKKRNLRSRRHLPAYLPKMLVDHDLVALLLGEERQQLSDFGNNMGVGYFPDDSVDSTQSLKKDVKDSYQIDVQIQEKASELTLLGQEGRLYGDLFINDYSNLASLPKTQGHLSDGPGPLYSVQDSVERRNNLVRSVRYGEHILEEPNFVEHVTTTVGMSESLILNKNCLTERENQYYSIMHGKSESSHKPRSETNKARNGQTSRKDGKNQRNPTVDSSSECYSSEAKMTEATEVTHTSDSRFLFADEAEQEVYSESDVLEELEELIQMERDNERARERNQSTQPGRLSFFF